MDIEGPRKRKGKLYNGRMIADHTSDEGLISKICKELSLLNKRIHNEVCRIGKQGMVVHACNPSAWEVEAVVGF